MTTYTTNRDGGKTNEEGHIRFQTKVWSGNVATGLQAVARSPLAMGINVSIGDAKVDYSTYSYTVWTDAVEAVGITTADPSNPRIDRIVGYVDRSVTPSSANSNNPGLLKFMAIAGTPAASPAAPSDVTVQAAVGASNPYFNIANVLVGTGVTTIDNTKITDTRVFVTIPTTSIPNASVKSQNIDFTTISSGRLITSASYWTKSTAYNTAESVTGLSVALNLSKAGKIKVWGCIEINNNSASANYVRVRARLDGVAQLGDDSVSFAIPASQAMSIPVSALISSATGTKTLDIAVLSDSNLVFQVIQGATNVNYEVN